MIFFITTQKMQLKTNNINVVFVIPIVEGIILQGVIILTTYYNMIGSVSKYV
jgi:hypothetical protein